MWVTSVDNVSYELVEDASQVDGQQFELVCEQLEFEFVDNNLNLSSWTTTWIWVCGQQPEFEFVDNNVS